MFQCLWFALSVPCRCRSRVRGKRVSTKTTTGRHDRSMTPSAPTTPWYAGNWGLSKGNQCNIFVLFFKYRSRLCTFYKHPSVCYASEWITFGLHFYCKLTPNRTPRLAIQKNTKLVIIKAIPLSRKIFGVVDHVVPHFVSVRAACESAKECNEQYRP